MVKCVKVSKKTGNDVRNLIKNSGILNIDARIGSDDSFLYIPITEESFRDYEIVDMDLEPIEHKETNYRMFLPEDVRDRLPNSFDVVGDVIIVKIPDDLIHLKNEIGNAILAVTKNARIVLMDSGVKGELRIRDLEKIAGEGTPETIHREYGVSMITDPSKVYFNPRLATERERIASLVKDGETIIDMFAGIAPFPMVICKHANPKIVYAIDLNHDAVEFMKRNIDSGGFKKIVAIEGDAVEAIRDLPEADRIIMNLPQMADKFLHHALSKLKKGGTVHMHKILERENCESYCSSIVGEMKNNGFECKIKEIHELKTYSPSSSVYVLDIVKI